MFIFEFYIQFLIAELTTPLGMVTALEARQFNIAFSYQLTTAPLRSGPSLHCYQGGKAHYHGYLSADQPFSTWEYL